MSPETSQLVAMYRRVAALCGALNDLHEIARRLEEAERHRRELLELLRDTQAMPEFWQEVEAGVTTRQGE